MKLQLKKESQASHGFFSPVKVNYPYVLTRQELITEVYQIEEGCEIKKMIQFAEANQVYDYFWANEQFYIILVKDHPLFLRSLETGKTVQKYPIYSHLFEVKTPYCGFCDKTSIFTCLGNIIHKIDLKSGEHLIIPIKSKKMRPRTVSTSITQSSSLIVIGSHSSTAFLIDQSSGKLISEVPSVPRISQLMIQDLNLYIGGRKNNHIEIWDLRMLKFPKHLQSIPRDHPNHQKILFDVDNSGNLAVGDPQGDIRVFNRHFQILTDFPSHFDAVNSVQFSPDGLLSSSGQRHFKSMNIPSLIREFIWTNN
jgi:WD40 repeat protein